jgi:uncharacterized SAM-binding protein YcdF (DUF218 family)
MANLVKQLLQPVAIVWLILIVMCVWQIYRHQYRWASINGLMVFGLFLFGCTPLSGYLLSTLEKPYVRENLDVLPEADVVVVLGGMVSGSSIEPTGFDVGSAADRILTGLELIRLGKARHLIVGGGSFGPRAHRESEYSVLKPWIERWELIDVPISHLGMLESTREEADKVASMMADKKWEIVILVTSAWHMRRAKAVFQTAGVKVIPVGCDFMGNSQNPATSFGERYTLVPQSGRLDGLRIYLHEWVGWLYYRSRGWIKPIK